ncbi:MAG: addiction module protein [Gammaproteobacteria bacterium]|nr:addiction module protein [Gammaproteobacteria bacterium]
MTSLVLDRLRSEALNLSESERAELAHALLTSLDGPPDADALDSWDVEISRRLAAIDEGSAKLIDRDEFRRRLRNRIGS